MGVKHRSQSSTGLCTVEMRDPIAINKHNITMLTALSQLWWVCILSTNQFCKHRCFMWASVTFRIFLDVQSSLPSMLAMTMLPVKNLWHFIAKSSVPEQVEEGIEGKWPRRVHLETQETMVMEGSRHLIHCYYSNHSQIINTFAYLNTHAHRQTKMWRSQPRSASVDFMCKSRRVIKINISYYSYCNST